MLHKGYYTIGIGPDLPQAGDLCELLQHPYKKSITRLKLPDRKVY